jgi:plastocyanin
MSIWIKNCAGTMAIALLLVTASCKKGGSATGEATAKPSVAYTPIDWDTAGVVSGTVHFTKKAPPRIEIDMAQDPACGLAGGNYSEQFMVHDGGLQNVFVYVKDGLGNKIYAAPAAPVTLDQKGCKYVPHVIGVMVGQQVQFTNSDGTMHNVHITPEVSGNAAMDISQPPMAGTTTRVFSQPELMLPVRCNNHPWMQAFINVAPSPFSSVTDANGHFEIKGLPPGTYTIVADHEELGQQTATVTVQTKQTTAQDFTYGNGAGTAAQ